MNTRRWNIVLTGMVVAFLAGCGPAQQATKEQPHPQNPESNAPREVDKSQALDHFIEGTLLDSKGELPRAILEYQDALRFDQDPAIYYAISRDYSLLGKHALAAEAAKEAIRRDSTNISYHENLAAIYQNAFQPALAIKEYETVLGLDSNSVTAWYSLARLYQPTRPLKALEIYEKLLDREGDTWELLLQSADLYSSLGRFDEAADHYKRLLKLDPSNRALQRQLAETYNRAGKQDQAIAILKKLMEVDDSDLDVVAALADVYLDNRQYDEATKLYERLLSKEKNNPQIKMRIGIAYFGQVERDSTFLPKAKSIFEEAAKELHDDWRPLWYLGAIADLEKQDSAAMDYFEQVTKLQGGTIETWWYVGSHLFDRGEHRQVVELMEKAKKMFPRDFRVYLLLGLSYSRLGNDDAAVENLRTALRYNPNDANTMGSLALTLDGMKRFGESDSLYEAALKIDPNDQLLLNNYSYSLAERGLQLERALQMSTEAVNAEPENSSYLDTLGWIYFKLGKYAEAAKYVAKAAGKDDASAVVKEHLGDIYFKLGNQEKALDYWNQALKMDSSNQSLKNKIERGTL